MQNSILTVAASLSDGDLLARLHVLARTEREATAELVAHLAELDTRAALYAADGYGSLFGYCTQALRLSEDAACNRIEAARVCRQYPCALDLLAAGKLTLTSVRLLGRHLTAENHRNVLARAVHKSRREIAVLVAELAPRPDVPSLVRKLPSAGSEVKAASPKEDLIGGQAVPAASVPAVPAPRPAPRPVVEALAPTRYRVQFTIGEETEEKLRRLQSLLRREIPDGDPAVIFDRAVSLLLEKVERTKLGKAVRPRPLPAIRSGTDKDAAEGPLPPRDPPNAVKRAVWARDEGHFGTHDVEGYPGYGFTGREWDPETGLYYYRARYYDPKIGRFISEDPAGPVDSLNLYTYVVNDPIGRVDPMGLWTIDSTGLKERPTSDPFSKCGSYFACTRIQVKLDCKCTCDGGGCWRATAVLNLIGDVFVYNGPFSVIKQQKPDDPSVTNYDSAYLHELRYHIGTAIGGTIPFLEALEAKRFPNEIECIGACAAAKGTIPFEFMKALRATKGL